MLYETRDKCDDDHYMNHNHTSLNSLTSTTAIEVNCHQLLTL